MFGLTRSIDPPIDPPILAAIGHRFIEEKKHLKNADSRVWGDARRDQKIFLLA